MTRATRAAVELAPAGSCPPPPAAWGAPSTTGVPARWVAATKPIAPPRPPDSRPTRAAMRISRRRSGRGARTSSADSGGGGSGADGCRMTAGDSGLRQGSLAASDHHGEARPDPPVAPSEPQPPESAVTPQPPPNPPHQDDTAGLRAGPPWAAYWRQPHMLPSPEGGPAITPEFPVAAA